MFRALINATGQDTTLTPEILLQVQSQLSYDYPNSRQRFDYYEGSLVDKPYGSELWLASESLICEIDWMVPSCDCFTFVLPSLSPNWLANSTYVMSTYLLDVMNSSRYKYTDLWTKAAPLGITQSFTVNGSNIAQPVRLGGPGTDVPNSWSILEFTSFEKVTSFDSGFFVKPSFCKSGAELYALTKRHSSILKYFVQY
jgi:hypothetical protein